MRAFIGALCALSACVTPTQTVVYIDVDDALRMAGTHLQVETQGQRIETIPLDGLPLPVPKFLHPRNGDAARTFRLDLRVLNAAGETLVERRVVGGFLANRLGAITVRLSENCRGVSCGPGSSCAEGSCEPLCYGLDSDAAPSEPIPCAGECEGQGELAPCEIGGEPGLCRAGACCTGCWEASNLDGGGACLSGQEREACGFGGSECTPLCGAETCEDGVVQVGQIVRDVHAASDQSCALNATSTSLWCWGVVTEADEDAPVRRPREERTEGVLALTQRGYCVANFGTGVECNSPWPLEGAAPTSGTYREISAGRNHACAIARMADGTNGEVVCWGANDRAQLGRGFTEDMQSRNRAAPIMADDALRTTWTQLRARHSTTWALNAGRLYVWGSGDQMGFPGRRFTSPTEVSEGPFAQVAAAQFGMCALDEDGALFCNAGFTTNVLGLGALALTPTFVHEGPFASVAAGKQSVCVITEGDADAGQIRCRGDAGLLGSNTAAFSTYTTHRRWQQVAVGEQHGCAIRDDGSLWCFGSNTLGQLGLAAVNGEEVAGTAVPRRVCFEEPRR